MMRHRWFRSFSSAGAVKLSCWSRVKALVGNSAYRRYPRPAARMDVGKLAEEARYGGITVVRTNANVPPLEAAIPGHVFCSFMALVLSKERRRSAGQKA